MNFTADPSAAVHPVFDACVDAALSHAGPLMRGLVAAVRDMLYQQSRQQASATGGGVLSEARSLLGRHGAGLVEDFPEALCAAMAGVRSPIAQQDGEDNDDDRPAALRARRTLAHAVADTLPVFTALICGARGLAVADEDQNPLRPEVYLQALQIAVDRIGVPAKVQRIWLEHFCAALGPQLASEYTHLADSLVASGVAPAPLPTQDAWVASAPAQPEPPAPAPEPAPALLDELDFDFALEPMSPQSEVRDTDPEPVAGIPPLQADEAPVDERTALTQRIAADIAGWPEMREVTPAVRDFVLGPWSEVIAASQRSADAGSLDRDGYYALVRPLLWSARPEAGRADVERLVGLVPSLLSRLRAGLRTIDYPPAAEEAFLKELGELHRIATRAPGSSFRPRQEAREDGTPAALKSAPLAVAPAPAPVPAAASDVLSTGAWIESLQRGRWIRMQLSWVSPRHSLLLFTADDGSTESMTRRSCLQRMAERRLRILPDFDLDLPGA